MHERTIGLEAIQREQSLSKLRLHMQVSRIGEIKRELASIGASTVLSIHAPYTPIGRFDLASESSKIRRGTIEAVTRCVQLAEDTEASVVNAHLGGIIGTRRNRSFRDPAAKSASLGRVKDALVDIAHRIEGRNVRLAIENVPYPLEEITRGYSPLIGIFPNDFSQILGEVGSKYLGLTIDFCHLWITHKTFKGLLASANKSSSGEATAFSTYSGLTSYEANEIESLAKDPFGAFIKRLRERVFHIHVADTVGTYVPGKSSVIEGSPLGSGDLDLQGLGEALHEIEEHSTAKGTKMIVLEPKETDFKRPLSTLASLINLKRLMKEKVWDSSR
jgi:sugar phosphate isomerase/epimerase